MALTSLSSPKGQVACQSTPDTDQMHNGTAQRGRDLTSKEVNCQFLTIAKHGIDLYRVEKGEQQVFSSLETKAVDENKQNEVILTRVKSWSLTGSEIAEFSPLGNWLGIGSATKLKLFDPSSDYREIGEISTGVVRKLCFSPKGTFSVVLTQLTSQNDHNVKVYKNEDRSLVCSFSLKGATAQERWPPLRWTDNEAYCFRSRLNEIQVFAGNLTNFSAPASVIEAERLKGFAASCEQPEGKVNVALFISPSKDRPAVIRILSLSSPTAVPVELNSKSFFQVQNLEFEWNSTGSALLAVAHTDVDNTGRSYYGTSGLYYLEVGITNEKKSFSFWLTLHVSLLQMTPHDYRKFHPQFIIDGYTQAALNGKSLQIVGGERGPVADSRWAPTTNEFIVINGPIPPSINLFDGRTGEAKLSFGESRRNTIRFNPFGRFILLAGFGNMAGDIDIWDKYKKKIIGSAKAACTVECEWSPDGRMILCATTAPRMRVDNCVKLLRYNGDLLAKLDIPDLYFTKWLPAAPGVHLDRGTSRGRQLGPSPATIEAPKAYRPPKSTEAFEARIRAQKKEAQTTATDITSTTTSDGVVTMSKSAKKNAARKAKKIASQHEK